jgi:uncharacterized protein YwqG
MFQRTQAAREHVPDVAARAAHLAQPALAVTVAPFPLRGHQAEPVRSWFVGTPVLPPPVEWPQYEGRRLDFLACLDLAEAQATLAMDWLPATGNLSFFYDMERQPWGFDPKHRGGWRVIYQPGQVAAAANESRAAGFRKMLTYPPPERPEVKALSLTDAKWDAYCLLELEQTGHEAYHQLGGIPKPIQGDVLPLESQLVSNGVYCGNTTGWKSSRARELEPGAAQWRLLFQVASKDDLGFVWGDCGNLYFMIREEDARAARFENAWLIQQCS